MDLNNFNNEKDILLQYKKVATILEVLSMTKHFSNFKTTKSTRDMIQYMLNEMGMKEFSESLLPIELGLIEDIEVSSFPQYYNYLKKNNYIVSKLNKNETCLIIKILDNYILKLICVESEEYLVHGLELHDNFIYMFTSKVKNTSILYYPEFIFSKSIFPFLENSMKNFKKDMDSTNKRLNVINNKSNMLIKINMHLDCTVKTDLFKYKDDFLKRVQKSINMDIRDVIRKKYGLQYLDVI